MKIVHSIALQDILFLIFMVWNTSSRSKKWFPRKNLRFRYIRQTKTHHIIICFEIQFQKWVFAENQLKILVQIISVGVCTSLFDIFNKVDIVFCHSSGNKQKVNFNWKRKLISYIFLYFNVLANHTILLQTKHIRGYFIEFCKNSTISQIQNYYVRFHSGTNTTYNDQTSSTYITCLKLHGKGMK